MCDLLVQMEGVSLNSSLCQKTQLSLVINKNKSPLFSKNVKMMFCITSLLPMSSNFEGCIAFSSRIFYQSRLLMHRMIYLGVLLMLIHSSILQIFSEYLLCPRNYSRC